MNMTKQTMKLAAMSLSALLLASCGEELKQREHCKFIEDWAFAVTDTTVYDAYDVDFDDSEWRRLDLPHDWAIEGDFSETNPSGVGGGALPGGLGWYRKEIDITKEDLKGRVYITFDGVYMNSTVFVNGIKNGTRPYGYSSFVYDITPDLKEGRNVIAVKVDNTDQPNSRWYSGCGIYRNVWLTKTHKVHVVPWGVFVSTPLVNDSKADVKMSTTVANKYSFDVDVDVFTTISNDSGRVVATDEGVIHIEAGKTMQLEQSMKIVKPQMWDVESPSLYTASTVLRIGGVEIDQYSTTFGVRSFYFDDKSGFILNGRSLKLNGVCLHHDLGCLGAAVNTRAIERQLEMLKEMGCNAVRCTHNPPAPELLDLCDRMGMLVIDEAFDMWRRKKTERDYARFFDEWHERDLADLIRRDRNHPSVIAWSIGNEVLEQWAETETTSEDAQQANIDIAMGRGAKSDASETLSPGAILCQQLAEIVHREDPTRPVTAGCNEPSVTNNLFRANALDLIGFNYHNAWFDSVPEKFKGRPFYVSESNSALMTRGYYKMPSTRMFIMPDDWRFTSKDPSLSCSSYDNCHVPWGSTHELTMLQVRNNDFIAGQFVWTGFDYIGEPTPYGWPARSSYFGIIDLAGIPKDVYYLYQAEWQSEKTVLHLFPHWNWERGEEVDMWCYFNNADEVELFVNGRSKGVRKKSKDCLHAMWRVNFEPGECRVVSRKDGKQVAERKVVTAGRPAAIRLTPDRSRIHADGHDLSFVTVEVVDADGNLCPAAQNDIAFQVEGAVRIEGVDNGSPFSLERFKDNHRKAFYGKCMVVLRSTGGVGNARLTATSADLELADVVLNCLNEQTY